MSWNFSLPEGEGPWYRRVAVVCLCILAGAHFFEPPVALAFDPHEDNCLPDLHLALLVNRPPSSVAVGDYVFWKPSGPTSEVKAQYLLKWVAGVGGDRLTIKNRKVSINGHVVATGLDLLDPERADPLAFERDEIIPAGSLFVIGTHPHSFDSRYWGYLNVRQVQGKAFKVM